MTNFDQIQQNISEQKNELSENVISRVQAFIDNLRIIQGNTIDLGIVLFLTNPNKEVTFSFSGETKEMIAENFHKKLEEAMSGVASKEIHSIKVDWQQMKDGIEQSGAGLADL